ncbi:peptidoglycan-binding protein LysM [Lactococcus lactis subsp. lactis]|nr:peptidoglycan-binding protein LysM [Lactococcus lactis subsp. lactis]
MSTKEPWNNEIYRAMKEESTEMKRHDRARDESKRPLTTRFFDFPRYPHVYSCWASYWFYFME